jgi:hypothetical protein
MFFEYWRPKATDTHSKYVMSIAFQRQQWLRERSSILRTCTRPVRFTVLYGMCTRPRITAHNLEISTIISVCLNINESVFVSILA